MMREKIIKFERSKITGKKYTAYVKNKATQKIRKIHFGASDYQQFKDRTPLKLYAYKNHNDRKRMQNYFNSKMIVFKYLIFQNLSKFCMN